MNTTSTASHGEIREGKVAKSIEKQTAKLPSDVFLWAAGASIAGSLALQLFSTPKGFLMRGAPTRLGQISSFVGQWAPTLLVLGLYNKLVKVAGSDRYDRGSR